MENNILINQCIGILIFFGIYLPIIIYISRNVTCCTNKLKKFSRKIHKTNRFYNYFDYDGILHKNNLKKEMKNFTYEYQINNAMKYPNLLGSELYIYGFYRGKQFDLYMERNIFVGNKKVNYFYCGNMIDPIELCGELNFEYICKNDLDFISVEYFNVM